MGKMKFLIDIYSMNKQYSKFIKEKVKKYNGEYNIAIMILQQDKTTTNKLINKVLGETFNQETDSLSFINSNNISIYCNPSQLDSTCDETKSYKIYNYPDDFSYSFRLLINEQKLNSARATFCLKNKLNDRTYTQKRYEINQPPKYKINNECFTFIYPNLNINNYLPLIELLKSNKLNICNLFVD